MAITPRQLQSFIDTGLFKASTAQTVDQTKSANLESNSETLEELEFESSWQAATQSRAMQSSNSPGLVLAVDLDLDQVGATEADHVELICELKWSQVQSLLLAETEEPELSWFAAQEIPTYLPQWLA